MEARLKVELAGARLGNLRRNCKDPMNDDILAAEIDLAEAQFEWAVEKAMVRHTPSKDLVDRLCIRLQSVAA